ncbi:Macrophage mannose receptor 1 [Pseudolycoriella hygida]|uniref:Macrophage mannose receptor 1 n=1 Tax=Pseudolycoriella hygida TaxID=35572 RepID=A0A9Q0MY26_9DIPT|nr:Macrophage mannose receptor 1 [Pseudolycoriella hygida]
MKKVVFCVTLICSIVAGFDVNVLCGEDWLPFLDEKCVKLFTTFVNKGQAEAICEQNGATLITIKSASEQKFLSEIVLKISDDIPVHIGAERRPDNGSEFVWHDGTPVLRYTNWAPDRPSADERRSCVQMQPEILSRPFSESVGLEWVDLPCSIGGWFVCQKLQTWPTDYLQTAVLEARRAMERNVNSFTDSLVEMTDRFNAAKTELKYLQDNPVPIGFVYVQLPHQPEPWRMWWAVDWTEITEDYAGLFFRVAGEDAGEFGTVQEENSPRLTRVQGQVETASAPAVNIAPSGLPSAQVSSGWTGSASHWGMRFTVSSGEVRPRNTATRVWMRAN